MAGLLADIHRELESLAEATSRFAWPSPVPGGLPSQTASTAPFVQEVIAETRAIDKEYPRADVIIELGGEDAKIISQTDSEQRERFLRRRYGAFIDQMATLDTDAAG